MDARTGTAAWYRHGDNATEPGRWMLLTLLILVIAGTVWLCLVTPARDAERALIQGPVDVPVRAPRSAVIATKIVLTAPVIVTFAWTGVILFTTT
jgi:hypothetical protein